MSKRPKPIHEKLVADWEAHTVQQLLRNRYFMHKLRERVSDGELIKERVDAKAAQIHDKVFSVIDCTKCARCCKHPKLAVYITEEDRERIINHLGITVEEFERRYQENDPTSEKVQGMKQSHPDHFVFKTPCAFLKDNLCSIYEVRPQGCRDFPARGVFVYNAAYRPESDQPRISPAMFYITEQMRRRYEDKVCDPPYSAYLKHAMGKDDKLKDNLTSMAVTE